MRNTKFMFIISLRKLKKVFMCVIIALICGLLILFICSKKQNITCQNNNLNISAKDNNSRVLFLKECGLEVRSEPVEICDIIIPSVFNNTFSAYNEIQKSQGFDLSKYSGKSCQKYTYQILNFSDCKDPVKADILVYKNKIIAGNIFKSGHDGFIKPILIAQQ